MEEGEFYRREEGEEGYGILIHYRLIYLFTLFPLEKITEDLSEDGL